MADWLVSPILLGTERYVDGIFEEGGGRWNKAQQ